MKTNNRHRRAMACDCPTCSIDRLVHRTCVLTPTEAAATCAGSIAGSAVRTANVLTLLKNVDQALWGNNAMRTRHWLTHYRLVRMTALAIACSIRGDHGIGLGGVQ